MHLSCISLLPADLSSAGVPGKLNPHVEDEQMQSQVVKTIVWPAC